MTTTIIKTTTKYEKKTAFGDQRDAQRLKNTCSYRELGFSFQYPHGSSQLSLLKFQGVQIPSFYFHEHQALSGQEQHKPKALLWRYIKNFINSTIGRKETQEKPSETFPQRRYTNDQKVFDLNHQRNTKKNKEDHFPATAI